MRCTRTCRRRWNGQARPLSIDAATIRVIAKTENERIIDAMIAVRRKSISLLMSLVLTIFSICQVQAWAAVPSPVESAKTESMTDCHGGQTDTPSAAQDCHNTCQHLQQHNDVAQKLPLPDVTPVLLVILQPFELPDAGYIIASAYRPPDSSVIHPSPTIRFQRFLN